MSDPRFDPARDIRAPRGSDKTCKTWGAEAAYRMIQNNLDKEVAENPQALVERVLSALFRYDAEHGSELVRSLRVFLEENRSWRRAAERLNVHKQTLVYRMNRVAELTGRRTDRTNDVAELWVALRAYDATRLADG